MRRYYIIVQLLNKSQITSEALHHWILEGQLLRGWFRCQLLHLLFKNTKQCVSIECNAVLGAIIFSGSCEALRLVRHPSARELIALKVGFRELRKVTLIILQMDWDEYTTKQNTSFRCETGLTRAPETNRTKATGNQMVWKMIFPLDGFRLATGVGSWVGQLLGE